MGVVAGAARKRILFVGGTLNQTTMMHKVAARLSEHECAFTPFYADGLLHRLAGAGWLDFTILAGQARWRSLDYLGAHGLTVDERGERGGYDLAVLSTDL